MIIFYILCTLIVCLVLAVPFMIPKTEEEEQAFFKLHDTDMNAHDVRFRKNVLKETLDDMDYDLKTQKMNSEDFESLKKDVLESAHKLMKDS